MTTPERVFDGDLLQARLWLPDRPTTALYVTFRHWLPEPGSFDAQGRVQRALGAGLAHLHVQSRWNDWFLNPRPPRWKPPSDLPATASAPPARWASRWAHTPPCGSPKCCG